MMPEDTTLTHDGAYWTLTFGTYRLRVKACSCDLIRCTCKRKPARSWGRAHSHERTHCHSGHEEHMAVIFRRAIR